MQLFFAHGGETHDTATQSAWHAITSEWYIALPIYLIILFAIGAAVYLITKSRAATFNVLLAVFFVAGIALYATTPVVSIVSLAAGFTMALILVLTNIGGSH